MRWAIIVALVMILASKSAGAQLYNTTNLTNANNFYDQTKALNDIVDGMLGVGILIAVFVITFVIVSGYSIPNPIAAFGAASFFTALSAGMLLPLGFIGFWIFELCLLLAGVGITLSLIVK